MDRDFDAELDALFERHYYSEEPELFWALRQFDETMGERERIVFRQIMLRRLEAGPSLSNIFVCGCIDLPESAPGIAAALNREDEVSQMSRTMMNALRRYPGDHSYAAVERFLDSSQEIDVLQHLAAMDFERTFPHLRAALLQDHLLEVTLHILGRVLRNVGFTAFAETLRQLLDDPRKKQLAHRLTLMLDIKPDATNPFSVEDIQRIKEWLTQ